MTDERKSDFVSSELFVFSFNNLFRVIIVLKDPMITHFQFSSRSQQISTSEFLVFQGVHNDVPSNSGRFGKETGPQALEIPRYIKQCTGGYFPSYLPLISHQSVCWKRHNLCVR